MERAPSAGRSRIMDLRVDRKSGSENSAGQLDRPHSHTVKLGECELEGVVEGPYRPAYNRDGSDALLRIAAP